MADELADGSCRCGGRLFSQQTVVLLTPATFTVKPVDGRHVKLSEDVRKFYTCLACGLTYLYNEEMDEWRKP